MAKLQNECDNATEEISKIKDELDVWQENVSFYEQRFHKITAATGLSRPEEIVNKFFFNDEITSDLSSEIEHRQAERDQLLQLKAEHGTTLILEAQGESAETVVEGLARLFASNFQVPRPPPSAPASQP